jgi:hypothetical protein
LGVIQEENIDKAKLALDLTATLIKQGFTIDKGFLRFDASSKTNIRELHSIAVNHLLEKNYRLICKYDQKFTNDYIANGNEVNVQKISPKLIIVNDAEMALVFNWIKLHWSIPVSAGYGRRLRYLIQDTYNNKIIGLIGLGDPVYALKDRDHFIGWTSEIKARKLKHIMDAFVLGSIPPYSMILGGKLVASLTSSKELFSDFKAKYNGKKSLIKEEIFDGTLAGITTTSALGKSAVYDRIKIPNGSEFHHVGWTCGSGDFQFLNGHYDTLANLVKQQKYTGKNKKWGTGIRSRRTVISKSLSLLGLSPKFAYHGIKRELFFVPLCKNWKAFLCENSSELEPYNVSVREITDHIKVRWMIPRSERDSSYQQFKREHYSLMLCKPECNLINS